MHGTFFLVVHAWDIKRVPIRSYKPKLKRPKKICGPKKMCLEITYTRNALRQVGLELVLIIGKEVKEICSTWKHTSMKPTEAADNNSLSYYTIILILKIYLYFDKIVKCKRMCKTCFLECRCS